MLLLESKSKYQFVIDMIQEVTVHNLQYIDYTVNLYFMLPIYIHTINLVRWFAVFRNNGQYNKDTYQSSITQIFKIKQIQKNLLKKA